MRLVIDTNVIVSAVIWGGTPHKLLQAMRRGNASIFTCAELITELEGVLRRQKFASQLALAGITADDVSLHFQKLSTLVQVTPPYTRWTRDPKDDVIFACAMAAQADAIVSGDYDLLVLGSVQNIQILRPRQALQYLSFRRGFP